MINSDDRKLELSGWLMENDEDSYNDPLKLQKFLFFYESFSKANGKPADFDYLRGYKNGPVFSSVYGDYTKERNEFDQRARECYLAVHSIDDRYAVRSDFVVKILSDEDLSDLTHQMNIWSAKADKIFAGHKQVSLDESDFNQDDVSLMHLLESMYPDELIANSCVMRIRDHYFVFSEDDYKRLTDEHRKALFTIARHEELHNPVYVEIDEEGSLLID